MFKVTRAGQNLFEFQSTQNYCRFIMSNFCNGILSESCHGHELHVNPQTYNKLTKAGRINAQGGANGVIVVVKNVRFRQSSPLIVLLVTIITV